MAETLCEPEAVGEQAGESPSTSGPQLRLAVRRRTGCADGPGVKVKETEGRGMEGTDCVCRSVRSPLVGEEPAAAARDPVPTPLPEGPPPTGSLVPAGPESPPRELLRLPAAGRVALGPLRLLMRPWRRGGDNAPPLASFWNGIPQTAGGASRFIRVVRLGRAFVFYSVGSAAPSGPLGGSPKLGPP